MIPRDAEYAVDRRDGYKFGNGKLRVEFPRGGGRRGGGFGGGRGGYGGRGRGPPTRSKYKVYVSGNI